MTNIRLGSIEEYKDVSAINAYHRFFRHRPKEKRLRRIHLSSRDSARTPMQWSGSDFAGFSTVQPWFTVNPNYPSVNVETEEKDPQSILNFYRKCLRLRKSSAALLKGEYREYCPHRRRLYMYERRYQSERVLVVCSFSAREQTWKLPKGFAKDDGVLMLCNYPEEGVPGRFRPYETRVLRFQDPDAPAGDTERGKQP